MPSVEWAHLGPPPAGGDLDERVRHHGPGRTVVEAMRVIVGLEPAEIALIVGRSAGAVRVTVHRALATLARTLSGGSDVVDVTTTTEEALTRRHG